MTDVASMFEQMLYAILNYAPYAFLGVYAFKTSLRWNHRVTTVLFSVSVVVEILLFLAGNNEPDPIPLFCSYGSVALNLAWYLGAVKARWGRKLFNLFMLKNVANCSVIIAKSLEGILFPACAETPYQWTNSLCLAIVLIIEMPILFLYINRFFTRQVRDIIGPKVWSFLWVIPFYFMLIWYDRFYYSGMGSLYLALQPKMIVIMTLQIIGELMVYGCVATMTLYYRRNYLLQEENNRLAQQNLQYDHITSHIKEVTTIRHDLRHNLLLMQQYCDQGQYDQLKVYLDQYVQQFPQQRIAYCGNTALNVLLVYYQSLCQEFSIDYQVDLSLPEELPLSEIEITVLFGNLLENAVQACEMVPEKLRTISVKGSLIQGKMVFSVSNRYANQIQRNSSGAFLSTKHKGEGIGTESVRSIIEKHDGTIQFMERDGTFLVMGKV